MKVSHTLMMEVLEVLSVGMPFCGFKLLSGMLCLKSVNPLIQILGGFLIAIGVLDVLINAGNLISLVIVRRRSFEPCLITSIIKSLTPLTQRQTAREIGNSLDVLISFSLVAIMVGGGFLSLIPKAHMPVWNFSVVLNVLGAGITRLAVSLVR